MEETKKPAGTDFVIAGASGSVDGDPLTTNTAHANDDFATIRTLLQILL